MISCIICRDSYKHILMFSGWDLTKRKSYISYTSVRFNGGSLINFLRGNFEYICSKLRNGISLPVNLKSYVHVHFALNFWSLILKVWISRLGMLPTLGLLLYQEINSIKLAGDFDCFISSLNVTLLYYLFFYFFCA